MVFEKIKAIIVEQMGIDEEDIAPESSLFDLGMDDFGMVEFVMAVEEEFNVEISDDDFLKLTTAHDVVEYIKANTQVGRL